MSNNKKNHKVAIIMGSQSDYSTMQYTQKVLKILKIRHETKENRITKPVVLLGMMGSGKSTIGKILAEKLNFDFIDTDNEIENIMDMTINQIFIEYGEQYFRLLETTFFQERIKNGQVIYSTGGGLILDKKNMKIVIDNIKKVEGITSVTRKFKSN